MPQGRSPLATPTDLAEDRIMTRAVVEFLAPAPALRPLLSAYYRVEHPGGAEPIEDLLHPEWANLRLALREDWGVETRGRMEEPAPAICLFGPTSRAARVRIQPNGVCLGIGLLPLGWAVLTGLEASAWADRMAGSDNLRGVGLTGLFDRARALQGAELAAVIDAVLLEVLDLPAAREEMARAELIARAHQALLDPEIGTVEAFAAALGVSVRQAARLSLKVFGFAPKLLLRRQRFLRTLAALRLNLDRPWGQQLDGHYYDQPHFVRDFRRFMGMSPTAYFALPRELLEIAAAARQSALGQPLQGLHAAR
jgi:AraC-like DNA-binding protein